MPPVAGRDLIESAPMKILVVGASGTIGRAVVSELGPRHEIVTGVDVTALEGTTTQSLAVEDHGAGRRTRECGARPQPDTEESAGYGRAS